jgi:hypothetical protein
MFAGLKYVDGWASVAVTVASLVVAGEDKADAPGKKRAPSTSKPPLSASTGASVASSASAATLIPVDERIVTFLLRDPASVMSQHTPSFIGTFALTTVAPFAAQGLHFSQRFAFNCCRWFPQRSGI